MTVDKPAVFRARDVVWETFLLGPDAEGRRAQARFMDLYAAGRLKDYYVSPGRIDAEVLPG